MDKSLDELIAESGPTKQGGAGGQRTGYVEPSSRRCYNCQQEGHEAKDCSNERVERAPDNKVRRCYNCQQDGHEAKDCFNERVERASNFVDKISRMCYTCGGTGHEAWQCPSVNVTGGGKGKGKGKGGGKGGKGGGTAKETSHTRTMRSNRKIVQEGSETVVRLYETEVVRIGDGTITLDSGGFMKAMTMDCMNEALEPFGFAVKENGDSWQVSDGKTLLRFSDGMKVPLTPAGKGGKGKGKGKGKAKGGGWWDGWGEWADDSYGWWGKGKGSGGAHRVVRAGGANRIAPY